MVQDADQVSARSAEALDLMVTHLFDAVRYSNQMSSLDGEVQKMEKQSESRLEALDEVVKELGATLERLSQTVEADYASQLQHQVMEFVDAAVDQAKARERDASARDLSEVDAKAELEKTKAVKSMESYLIASPLPLVDRVLTVKLKDSGYSAEVRYACKGEVGYTFSLSTQNSKFFHSGFTFAQMGRRPMLPVELQRTWIKKEPSPRYERLDRYVLVSAEASERHIIAEFQNEETGAKVRIASASADGESIPSVEYTEEDRTTNVTTDTGLNRFLDSKDLSSSIGILKAELLSLERSKAALKELTVGGDDLMESLDFASFLRTVLKLMGREFRAVVQSIGSKSLKTKGGELSLSSINERVSLLGQNSAIVRETLGLKP
ncbi:MAG TPA: hypothetical protein VEJ36_01930 [Nitrososphaerales archaeon]|nr:hypothetical protein [Nitrososphaerales archaeon]